MRPAAHLTPEQIRALVDEMAPRTNADGSINARHVAIELTLRSDHGHRSYIADLDGPGKFRRPEDPAPPGLSPLEVQDAAINQLAVASVAYRENRLALSRTIRWSVGYGIPLAEIVATTGLPEALVVELLDEVD